MSTEVSNVQSLRFFSTEEKFTELQIQVGKGFFIRKVRELQKQQPKNSLIVISGQVGGVWEKVNINLLFRY